MTDDIRQALADRDFERIENAWMDMMEKGVWRVSDFLAIAPFGPAVPPDAVEMVKKTKEEFIGGRKEVFQGPLKDNKGAERVKAGEVWPMEALGKMDWLVEGVIGQPK